MGTTRRKPGLLGPHVEGYRSWLAGRGYTPDTVRNMLKDLGQVGLWLQAERLQVCDLNEQQLARFLADRLAAGRRPRLGLRALAPLLTYLRATGATPPVMLSAAPLDVLLGQYQEWMRNERGLSDSTMPRYGNTARRFLREHAVRGGVLTPGVLTPGVLTPGVLTGADVNAFLLRECARVSAGSAKGRVAELRSVLRFLYLQQITPRRLDTAVPPVGGWRLAALPPPAMSAADVQRVLDGVDRSGDVGLRDFAIIMLIARLGLRSIEIARLELGDVDWRAGELIVRGKGRRHDRLPLPAEVGDAMVAYLSRGRNPHDARHLFLTCRAPRGPIRADLVGDVVERTYLRAGLPHVVRTDCVTRWPVSCCGKAPGWSL
jgi:site-specific recombinase XerD